MNAFELVKLKSGLFSLRSTENQETFHPGTGPSIEARTLHVEQQRLVKRSQEVSPLVIWDVGLGAAANAITALEALQSSNSQVEIHSFEKSLGPIHFSLSHSDELGYLNPHHKIIHKLLVEKHVRVSPHLEWRLHEGDFPKTLQQKNIPDPHAIFYDPYSPRGNPEMWSLEIFTALRNRLSQHSPCLLTNYSRSTSVRVTLLLAGFFVGHGIGIGEKSETTVASNCLSLIEKPITRSWLDRVKASRNSAPLRASCYHSEKQISDEDFHRLSQSPQFA